MPPVGQVLWIVAQLALVLAAGVNRTVDDTFGDSISKTMPVYEPAKAWRTGGDCTTCGTTPDDRSQIWNGTWHYASATNGEIRNVSVSFTGEYSQSEAALPDLIEMVPGTAVYVYCVVQSIPTGRPPWASSGDGDGTPLWVNANGTGRPPWANGNMTAPTNLTFMLDGNLVGAYVLEAHPPFFGFQYNVPVYVNSSLRYGNHSLKMISKSRQNETSVVLFDYVQYTYAPPPYIPVGDYTYLMLIVVLTKMHLRPNHLDRPIPLRLLPTLHPPLQAPAPPKPHLLGQLLEGSLEALPSFSSHSLFSLYGADGKLASTYQLRIFTPTLLQCFTPHTPPTSPRPNATLHLQKHWDLCPPGPSRRPTCSRHSLPAQRPRPRFLLPTRHADQTRADRPCSRSCTRFGVRLPD